MSSDLESQKLELEKQKLALEVRKVANESAWFHRHFATVVTAILTAGTLILSGVQWRVAQLELASAKLEREHLQEQEEKRREEEWRLKALEVVFQHESLFFGDDAEDFRRAVTMLAVGFPERVSKPILDRLREQVSQSRRSQIDQVQKRIGQGEGAQPAPEPPVRTNATPESPPTPAPRPTPRAHLSTARERLPLRQPEPRGPARGREDRPRLRDHLRTELHR